MKVTVLSFIIGLAQLDIRDSAVFSTHTENYKVHLTNNIDSHEVEAVINNGVHWLLVQ